ncbi:anti-sigma-D factor RsdA [Mycobacterium sp. 1245805.9]|uniref:anti-sigma-D factor RsdA n=1 Tax=Mycobacterium sp. 1245805.9 TaxID=1856862 RepID=UPI0009EF5B4E|nr:anti-sigma-D factor RsdA [Mycobacterium sp. 1245805.9]
MPESLDEFASTDLLLDALAERRPVDLDDPNDPNFEALTVLLADWRDDLRWPPASALVSPEEAVGALHAGLAERRRVGRGLATIGSVAATLLVLSGFGAMVVEARPGDTLYGLHAMFFDQPRVKDSQIELSAKAELAKVQQMIDQGQWTQAQNQLAEVSSTVQSMNDGASRNDLMDEVNLLNTRVESRNPNATLPPAAPKPKAPAASSTPPAAPRPSTTGPTAASTTEPSPSASPTTSPSSGRHRHHGHSSTPSSAAPGDTP